LICGGEQLPKLAGPEAVEAVAVEAVEVLAPERGFPWSSKAVTALKLVLKPKNLLNTGGNFQSHEINLMRHEPSACVPVFGGVAAFAADSACLHKSLAAWLALHVFVNWSHINWVMILMFCAEPWLYEAMVHEREQTCHSTWMCLLLRSTGSNAVSFLPSKPCANLICGVEQVPKSAPEALELVVVFDKEESDFAGVEDTGL